MPSGGMGQTIGWHLIRAIRIIAGPRGENAFIPPQAENEKFYAQQALLVVAILFHFMFFASK